MPDVDVVIPPLPDAESLELMGRGLNVSAARLLFLAGVFRALREKRSAAGGMHRLVKFGKFTRADVESMTDSIRKSVPATIEEVDNALAALGAAKQVLEEARDAMGAG